VHIVSLFIFKKENIKHFLNFVTDKRWDNVKSEHGRKRKFAGMIPFYERKNETVQIEQTNDVKENSLDNNLSVCEQDTQLVDTKC
jgi:hypothetical protein